MNASMTEEDLVDMLAVLDNDGDGEVSKEEFKTWFQANIKDSSGKTATDEEFEKLWKKIDSDGDGNLQPNEMCAYFGLNFDSTQAALETRNNMTDDDILQALQVQSQLYEAKVAMLAAEEEKKKKALTKRTATGARAGITVIKKDDESKENTLLSACDCIDSTDPATIEQLLDEGVSARIESIDKAQMPLHKLATNAQHKLIRKIVDDVAKKDKDAAKADINSQDKNGSPPIFLAMQGRPDIVNGDDAAKKKEFQERQLKTVLCILQLGADMYIENQTGWNTLHAAAHGDFVDGAKEILSFMERSNFSKAQIRRFINHKDSMGRTPLHIAAMRADESDGNQPEFVKVLLTKGADPSLGDKADVMPSQLAEKTGRRKSKELIDGADKAQKEAQVSYRRKSVSREIPILDPAALAPPPAAA